jgi:hypothetical protein
VDGVATRIVFFVKVLHFLRVTRRHRNALVLSLNEVFRDDRWEGLEFLGGSAFWVLVERKQFREEVQMARMLVG